MIIYGVCVGGRGTFNSILRPSLPETATVLTRHRQTSIFDAYNSILDEASMSPNVEALVLLHDDIELGADFEIQVRHALRFGDVIGSIGSIGPRSIAWWDADRRGRVVDSRIGLQDFGGGIAEVDTIDGLVMILSPVAQTLRFDSHGFRGFHGYDIDFCFQARHSGMRVIVAPLDLIHHSQHSLNDSGRAKSFWIADLVWQRKWMGLSRRRQWLRRTRLHLVRG